MCWNILKNPHFELKLWKFLLYLPICLNQKNRPSVMKVLIFLLDILQITKLLSLQFLKIISPIMGNRMQVLDKLLHSIFLFSCFKVPKIDYKIESDFAGTACKKFCPKSFYKSSYKSCHESYQKWILSNAIFYQMEIMSVFIASIDHCDLVFKATLTFDIRLPDAGSHLRLLNGAN